MKYDTTSDEAILQSIGLFLAAGAHWNPATETITRTRREIMKRDPRYIVRLLRLLIEKPSGANAEQFLELCRSSALERKIASVDAELLDRIKAMRKAKRGVEDSQ